LSFLIYGTTKAEVKGLDQIPHDQWPTALPLLYYAYHIMAGLGTWFVLLMIVSALSALAQAALHGALGFVGAAAQLSAALHRQHRRLDDRRTGPPALAHLWPDAHQRRLLEHRLGQQRPVYLAGLHGALLLLGILFTVLIYREISNGPEAIACRYGSRRLMLCHPR
jgi:cytochrome d ubiquinol oxidase subunit I